MPDDVQESELQAAINAWKTLHRLRDDDPVLLVAELFRIHLNHREQVAANPPPEAAATQGKQDPPAPVASAGVPEPAAAATLAAPEASLPLGIGRGAAVMALFLAAAGGYLLGKGWP